MPGYRAIYDEESSRVEAVQKGGVPFRIAILAAIEEVAGVLGDINEGDVSGREKESPSIVHDLETRREELEKETEAKVGGKPIVLHAEQQKVVDALVAEGDKFGYIDLIDHHKQFLVQAQRFLEGDRKVTPGDLLDYARDNGMDDFLKAMGEAPAPAIGMGGCPAALALRFPFFVVDVAPRRKIG